MNITRPLNDKVKQYIIRIININNIQSRLNPVLWNRRAMVGSIIGNASVSVTSYN